MTLKFWSLLVLQSNISKAESKLKIGLGSFALKLVISMLQRLTNFKQNYHSWKNEVSGMCIDWALKRSWLGLPQRTAENFHKKTNSRILRFQAGQLGSTTFYLWGLPQSCDCDDAYFLPYCFLSLPCSNCLWCKVPDKAYHWNPRRLG